MHPSAVQESAVQAFPSSKSIVEQFDVETWAATQ
jgi:hypothetical protein